MSSVRERIARLNANATPLTPEGQERKLKEERDKQKQAVKIARARAARYNMTLRALAIRSVRDQAEASRKDREAVIEAQERAKKYNMTSRALAIVASKNQRSVARAFDPSVRPETARQIIRAVAEHQAATAAALNDPNATEKQQLAAAAKALKVSELVEQVIEEEDENDITSDDENDHHADVEKHEEDHVEDHEEDHEEVHEEDHEENHEEEVTSRRTSTSSKHSSKRSSKRSSASSRRSSTLSKRMSSSSSKRKSTASAADIHEDVAAEQEDLHEEVAHSDVDDHHDEEVEVAEKKNKGGASAHDDDDDDDDKNNGFVDEELMEAVASKDDRSVNRAILKQFFETHAPHRVDEVDELLDEYADKDVSVLFEQLEAEYPDPAEAQATGEEKARQDAMNGKINEIDNHEDAVDDGDELNAVDQARRDADQAERREASKIAAMSEAEREAYFAEKEEERRHADQKDAMLRRQLDLYSRGGSKSNPVLAKMRGVTTTKRSLSRRISKRLSLVDEDTDEAGAVDSNGFILGATATPSRESIRRSQRASVSGTKWAVNVQPQLLRERMKRAGVTEKDIDNLMSEESDML